MTCNAFTVLYNHHHYLVPKHFHHPKRELALMKQSPPPDFSFPSVSGNHKLLSVSKDVPLLDISYKWNQVTCGLLCLASSTYHVLKVHLCSHVCQRFTPSCGSVLFHCKATPNFIYVLLLMGMWAVSTFWRLSRMLLWTFVYKCLFERLFSILWGHIPRSGIALVILYLTSWGPSKLPLWLHHFTFLPAIYEGFNFSTSLLTFLIFLFFFKWQSSYGEKWCLGVVSIWFLWWWWCWVSLLVLLSHLPRLPCTLPILCAIADKSVQKGVELGEWPLSYFVHITPKRTW